VNFHLGKLSFSKLAGFVQDVFGYSEFANVVKQSSAKRACNSLPSTFNSVPISEAVDLSSAHMAVSRLVFCIDRDRQRLNRVHVNLGHLLNVVALFGFCAAHFAEPLLVEPVQEMDQTGNQQTKKDKRQSAPLSAE